MKVKFLSKKERESIKAQKEANISQPQGSSANESTHKTETAPSSSQHQTNPTNGGGKPTESSTTK